MTTSPTPDQIGGVLFGSAYGDALAAPSEFMRSLTHIRHSFAPSGPTDIHAGRVTDDTQMMLAVARAVLDAPDFTPVALEMTLRAELNSWFHDLQRGRAWQAATVTPSKGCGANIRVQPLGLIADDAARAGAAQLQVALTHGHPTALAAADLTAQVIWVMGSGTAPPQLAPALAAYAQASQGWDECLGVLARLDAALASGIPGDADPCDFSAEGWIAEEALATGLLCFLLTPSDPVEAKPCAAPPSRKGDSDSLACLAGAFAGAHLGLSAFPAEWRTRTEYAGELQRLAAGFEGDGK